jgi:hypothetical protein
MITQQSQAESAPHQTGVFVSTLFTQNDFCGVREPFRQDNNGMAAHTQFCVPKRELAQQFVAFGVAQLGASCDGAGTDNCFFMLRRRGHQAWRRRRRHLETCQDNPASRPDQRP